jgi:hypothetical protein
MENTDRPRYLHNILVIFGMKPEQQKETPLSCFCVTKGRHSTPYHENMCGGTDQRQQQKVTVPSTLKHYVLNIAVFIINEKSRDESSRGSECAEYCLGGCDTVWSNRRLQTFRRNIQFFYHKNGGSRFLRIVGTFLPHYTASHAIKLTCFIQNYTMLYV